VLPLLAAFLLVSAGAAMAQPTCPPRGAPSLSVSLSDPEPRLLAPLPAWHLRQIAEGDEVVEHGQTLHHLGLTLSRVEWRSEITARSGGASAAGVCAVPAEIRLTLVHAEHVIRLAREIPRGGCLAGEVLAHERRHAEVNRRTLREAADGLRAAARAWAARAEARAPDVGAAALMLQDQLAAAVEPVLERLRQARAAQHAQIDSAEEYRRLGRVCPADQRRMRTSFGAH
jgi:hypothetical protein